MSKSLQVYHTKWYYDVFFMYCVRFAPYIAPGFFTIATKRDATAAAVTVPGFQRLTSGWTSLRQPTRHGVASCVPLDATICHNGVVPYGVLILYTIIIHTLYI